MNYPGDAADPKDVARWMASVAEEEYNLPGILPVMTSCVELTSAWTGPGDVRTVPGYLSAQDHDSLGYFQQRPSQGWGTPEQLIDADYALRAFLRAAESVEDDSPADTPEQLGAWCAAVQRPREDLEYLYAEKGYPIAKELLEGSAESTPPEKWPQEKMRVSSDGWTYVEADGNRLWLRGDVGDEFKTDTDGWLYKTGANPTPEPEPDKTWDWPIADDEPTVGDYVARHPTRYTWRVDVEEWARHLVDNYNVWCNTYYDHPEGYWRTEDSIDVWGPSGRGDPIDPALGDELFSLLFNDPAKPDIDWIIWRRYIYGAWNGWNGEFFGDGSAFTNHDDHIHVTYG